MSLINSGFDGTVTERDFSRIMRGAGVRDSVETVAAWAVTQGTGRQVSVAPGVAYAAGVVSDSGVAILAALPTPVNGQWHLVVRRITWANNTVTVATIPHTTTTTTIPTAPPAGFPVFNDNTGVLVDQHLAWAWVRSTDTTLAVFDLRSLPPARGVDLPVANFAALPTVGNFVGRQIAVLNTGTTFRWDGATWRQPIAGFILPTTTGSGVTVDPASGRVNFTTAALPTVTMFSAEFDFYEFDWEILGATGSDLGIQMAASGAPVTTGYDFTRWDVNNSGVGAGLSSSSAANIVIGRTTNTAGGAVGSFRLANPFAAKQTRVVGAVSIDGDRIERRGSGGLPNTTSYNGFSLTISSGSPSGWIRGRGVIN